MKIFKSLVSILVVLAAIMPQFVNAQDKVINVNLYGNNDPYNNTQWNNQNIVQPAYPYTSTAYKYSDGSNSTVTSTISFSQDPANYVDNGAGYGAGMTMCPQPVGRYACVAGGAPRTITFSNLNPAKKYDVILYCSRATNQGTTRNTINGVNIDINVFNNIANAATFTNITPNGSNQIVVTQTPLLTYVYINGFTIVEKASDVTANAGPNINLPFNVSSTTLNGSGTGTGTLTYAWSQQSGTTATIASPAAAVTNITGLTTAGARVFRLTVTGSAGSSTSDVTVTVNPQPTANGGGNKTISLPTTTTSLTGSGTGNGLTYAWTQIGGTAATIASPSSATTNITGLTTTGVRTFRLTVTDNTSITATNDVTVTVNAGPTANAGSPQVIALPTTTATLTGSGTGTGITYAWTQIGGTAATIASPSSSTTNITGLTTTGVRTFRLTVTDANTTTATSDVTVTVNANSNLPTLTASGPQTITASNVSFTSVANSPATITSTKWSKLSAPGQQVLRITVVGSSTAAGVGLTNGENNFVNRLKAYYKSQGVIDTIYNLAASGAFISTIDITAALNKGGQILLVSYPSNGYTAANNAATLAKFQEIKDSCDNRGVQFYCTGTQVRDDFGAADRANLIVLNDQLRTQFGARFIDFMPVILNTANNTIQSEFAVGDGIHVNDAAHERFFHIVRAANVFQNIVTSSSVIATPNSSNTSVTNLALGVHKFQVGILDSRGYGTSAITEVTVNSSGLPNTPPVANGGADKHITAPASSVLLDASASTDDHVITNYEWVQLTGTGGSLGTPNNISTNFTGLTPGVYTVELRVTDDSAAVSRDTVTITVHPPLNTPPVARAGNDQTIPSSVGTVNLDATASTDDHNIISYQWTKLTGTGGNITSPTSAQTTFTGLTGGTYTVELRVTDDSSAVSRDTMMITVWVPNAAPVARAGNDQVIVAPVSSVNLNGTTSTDDHNIVAYQWTKLTGTGGNITNLNASTTTFTGLTPGTYTVELRVTDDSSAVSRDTMMVTVYPPLNAPPVARAGNDQVIAMPTTTANLDGSASTDDHNIVGYLWTKLTGTGGNITSNTSPTTTFTGLSVGVYTVELRVTDDSAAVRRDTVQITVNDFPNVLPSANAGPNKFINTPANTVTLNGSGTDTDGSIVSYAWRQLTGTAATIASPAAATTNITGLTTVGVRTFRLKVIDNRGDSALSDVTVTVNAGSIIDPTDPVITYNPSSPPSYTNGVLTKWVRTVRLTWNTTSWKCYMLSGMPFRVKFPKSYVAGVDDGKKYPMLIFWHGLGEAGSKYDNEYSMANGGPVFNDAVNNDKFDGYIIIPQSEGAWGTPHMDVMKAIVDYMVINNKVDPFQLSVNGLSAGGYQCWGFQERYPQYVAASTPMSGVSTGNMDPANMANTKFTPIWLFQGGKDTSPDPNTANAVYAAWVAAGGNMTYTLYPGLGHGTWTTVWNEPDFWPFLNRHHNTNPWPLTGRTEFCPGDPINVTLGTAPGFDQYEWRKDGVLIGGATTHTLNVNSIGTYSLRLRKGTIWSEWSRVPVQIKIKTPTVTPPIAINGLMSKVIPALDTANVSLKVPKGYVAYEWQRVGNPATIGTDSILNVSTPGDYRVRVTEQFGCSSSFSAPFTVIPANGPNKPDAAINLGVSTISNTALRLDWSDNPSPVNNETNFEIYSSGQPGGPYKLIGIVGQDVLTFNATNLIAGKDYFFKVRAVNATAAAAASNEAKGTTTSDLLAPTTPQNLVVTMTSRTSVGLKWNKSTDDVGVTRYLVYVNGLQSFTTTDTTFTVNELIYPNSYNFTVRAADFAGNLSPFSNQVTGQPLLTGLNYRYYTYTGNWTALPDFQLMTPVAQGIMPNVALTPRTQDDRFAFIWEGFLNVTQAGTYRFRTNSDDGSRLYLGPLGGTTSPYSYSATPLVNNDGIHGAQDATSADINLSVGVYPIAITFYEEAGGESMTVSWRRGSFGSYNTIPNSAFSDAPVNNGSAPADPSNLVATAVSFKEIDLTWADNSNNETGFELYRSTNSSTGFVKIGQTGANATTFVDTLNLAASTTYFYQIRAIGLYGESNMVSHYAFTDASWAFNNNLNDGTGLGRNLTASGSPSYSSADKQEGSHSISLNGSTQSVTPPTTGNFLQNSFTEKTIAFWMKSNNNSGTNRVIVDIGGSDDGLALLLNNSVLRAVATSGSNDASFTVPYSSTGWNHIALVYRTNTLRLYINGTLAGSNTNLGFTSIGSTSNGSRIGTVNGSNAYGTGTGFFSGLIDNFIIYSKSLTPSDIALIMANQPLPQSVATTLALPALPAAPTQLLASGVSSSRIDVNWTDNANNETGIELYRSTTNNSNYLLLATLAPNTTSYIDSGLFANATYYYKVRTAGIGGKSAYSNEDSAMTKNNTPAVVAIPTTYKHYQATTELDIQATDADGEYLTLSSPNLPPFATLTQSASGVAKITFAPSAQGTYNGIIVNVADQHSGVNSTSFNLVVNDNFAPVVGAITDYTLNENDSVIINLSATDQNPADILAWAVSSNVPNNYVLTPGANGSATLKLKPDYAAAGVYTVTVTVSDGNGGTGTRQFSYTVVDKEPSQTIYTRMQYQLTMGAPWNNITGINTQNLKDHNGVTTPVGLVFQQPWWAPFWDGPTTGNNSGVYPDNVLREFWYFGAYGGPETASLRVTGLDPAKKYSLTFYAGSVFNQMGDNGTTRYTVGAETVSLYVQGNTQNTVTITNITPEANGSILVSMAKAPGTPIGYLNALIIKSVFNDSTAPAAPKFLVAQNVAGQGVKLTWQDVAFNEANYEVYRSTSANGVYSLINSPVANSTTFTDGTVSGATEYFYKVRAVNAYGNSAYADVVSIVTLNRIPSITPINDVTVKNNQTIQVNVTATDDPGDDITLTAHNLPSFATFIDNGNGTGVITIAPKAGTLGAFTDVEIRATDNSDSSRSALFDIFVVDANMSSIYVNITNGNNQAPAPWNNMTIGFAPGAGSAISNLRDDENVNTGITVTLTDGWTGTSETGMRRRNGTEVYPEAVSRAGIYFTDNNTHRITVSGLNTAKKYNFVFYNSHGTSENTLTNFNVGAQTVSLNGSYNSTETVQLNGIVPAANGTVVINVTKNGSALTGLLSGMVIQSYTPGVVSVFSPSNVHTSDYGASNAITISWQDRADNETAYEVWRASDGGSYSLLATLGANVTSYTNSNLALNSTYNYTVRARNGASTYSAYSTPVRGNTYATTVFLNANTNFVTGAPWNNLNWIYGVNFVWNNFKNEAGTPTNIGMLQPVKIDGMVDLGVVTGNNSGIFPDNVMKEGFGLFPGYTSYLKITGLNLSRTYDITVFNSLTQSFGDNSTIFIVNGKEYLLNALNNKSGTLTIFDVIPDQNGEAIISWTASPTAQFALLNAMIIKGYNKSTNPIPALPGGGSRTIEQPVIEDTTVTVTTPLVVTAAQERNVVPAEDMDDKPVNAYPNPFTSTFTLAVPVKKNNERVIVTVNDIAGRQIFQKEYSSFVPGYNNVTITPGNGALQAGIYFVRVEYVGQSKTRVVKMVKNNN